jgi:hypothetical protein
MSNGSESDSIVQLLYKDAQKIFLSFSFFSYNLPTGTVSSVLKSKFLLKICILQAFFR